MRTPTERQYHLLRMLASGSACVVGRKRDWRPLGNHGWVSWRDETDGHLAWVRITPDGLRALALAVEKHGLPELAPRRASS